MATAQILAIVTDMQKTLNSLVQKVDALDAKVTELQDTIGNSDDDISGGFKHDVTIFNMVSDLEDAVKGDTWNKGITRNVDTILDTVKTINDDMPRSRSKHDYY